MKKIKVCMISCLHELYDDRIYWKEALALQSNGYEVIHIAVETENRDFISEHGIRMIEIKRKRYFINPFINKLFRIITFRPNIYKKIFRIAKELKADVYHMHDLQLNRIGPKLKKLQHHPKIIYDVHEPYPEIIRYLHSYKGVKFLVRILYSKYIDLWQKRQVRKYDCIITTEENVALQFKKVVPSEKVRIIYNYSDLSINKNTSENKSYDVIYAGGISQWRGIWQMLEVARLSNELGCKYKFLFIGNIKGTNLAEKINAYIRDNKLTNSFELKEAVPYSSICEYYEKSRIGICIFSNNPVYRIIMPIKIFEYMAMGLPFISNDFGHSAEIINKEKCGIILKDNAPEEIFKAIDLLIKDKVLYKELSSNAKKSFSQHYHWSIMEKKLLVIYKELTKQ